MLLLLIQQRYPSFPKKLVTRWWPPKIFKKSICCSYRMYQLMRSAATQVDSWSCFRSVQVSGYAPTSKGAVSLPGGCCLQPDRSAHWRIQPVGPQKLGTHLGKRSENYNYTPGVSPLQLEECGFSPRAGQLFTVCSGYKKSIFGTHLNLLINLAHYLLSSLATLFLHCVRISPLVLYILGTLRWRHHMWSSAV